VIEYLRAKVSRLSKHAVAERSRTIIRGLAKDGLMEDGKEDLLERRCRVLARRVSVIIKLTLFFFASIPQLDASEWRVISSHSTFHMTCTRH